MGRGRGKGKNPTVGTSQEDPESGENEKIPAYGRRGKPQRPDNVEEETEAEKVEEDGENPNGSISIKDTKNMVVSANGRKRKRSTHAKEIIGSEKHENGIELKSSTDDSTKSIGFRQNGSRRKNKPCRAAGAGIICK